MIGISRSQFNYKSKKKEDPKVIAEIIRIKERYKRYGIRRVKVCLQRKGHHVNKKRVGRILKTLGLLVKKKSGLGRLKIAPLRPFPIAERVNQVWSIDFLTASLVNGQKFRCFTVVDIFSRQSPTIVVSFSMDNFLPLKTLEKLRFKGVNPESIILDNGPELNNNGMLLWSQKNNIKLHFIDPGEPIQNAYIESFNGRLRDECININHFFNIEDARRKITQWLDHYNNERPHSSLDYLTPKEFANFNESMLVRKIV